MEISVVNISKGPYELNLEAIEKLDPKKLSYNISSRLRYSQDSDYLGFQLDLMIMQGKTQLYVSGFLIGLAIAGWAKDLQSGLDLNKNREKIKEIIKTVWDIATGIVVTQSSSKQFDGFVLPSVNYEDFSKDVILIPQVANIES